MTRDSLVREERGDTILERELTNEVIGSFYDIHNDLGFGFVESVYCKSLQVLLHSKNIHSQREAPIEVFFRGQRVGLFRADLIVERRIIVEVKSQNAIGDADRKQLMNYLRATSIEVGLILNFGPRASFKRIILSNVQKRGDRSL